MKKLLLLMVMGLPMGSLSIAQPQLVANGEAEPLTTRDQYFMRPAWSPDGQGVAFTSRNHHGIWVLDLDAGKITNLVDEEGVGYEFSWSPDGKFVAYRIPIYENKRKTHAIEIVDIRTNKIQRLTEPRKLLGPPSWGHDNSMLFYVRNQELLQLETGLATADRLRKPAPGSGRFFVFTRYQQLQIATLKDTLDKKLHFPEEKVINPVLSPDGDHIVYEEVAGDLMVLSLLDGKTKSLGEGHRPAWSPDGEWICFMITEDDGHQYLASDIYVVGADGGQKMNLTKTKEPLEMNPAWAPDGNSIAFDEHLSGVILLQQIRIQ